MTPLNIISAKQNWTPDTQRCLRDTPRNWEHQEKRRRDTRFVGPDLSPVWSRKARRFIRAPAHTCDLPEAMLWMWTWGSSKTSRSWRSLCLCGHGTQGAHSMPKEMPSWIITEPVGEDAQWVGQVRKFFTQSGRREVRYSCFAVQLWFAVILSYFTCTDSSEEVIVAREDVPVPGIPGVPGQGHTVPSPSEVWLRILSKTGSPAITQSHYSFGSRSQCWIVIPLLLLRVYVYKILICSLYTQYFLFIYTVDRKYVQIFAHI